MPWQRGQRQASTTACAFVRRLACAVRVAPSSSGATYADDACPTPVAFTCARVASPQPAQEKGNLVGTQQSRMRLADLGVSP